MGTGEGPSARSREGVRPGRVAEEEVTVGGQDTLHWDRLGGRRPDREPGPQGGQAGDGNGETSPTKSVWVRPTPEVWQRPGAK